MSIVSGDLPGRAIRTAAWPAWLVCPNGTALCLGRAVPDMMWCRRQAQAATWPAALAAALAEALAEALTRTFPRALTGSEAVRSRKLV